MRDLVDIDIEIFSMHQQNRDKLLTSSQQEKLKKLTNSFVTIVKFIEYVYLLVRMENFRNFFSGIFFKLSSNEFPQIPSSSLNLRNFFWSIFPITRNNFKILKTIAICFNLI